MADHTANAMAAAARAMEEVVLPAIDPAHPLAREQAGLVLKYLRLWGSRLDHLYDRNRFELGHYLGLAQDLAAGPMPPSGAIAAALDEAVAAGRSLMDEPGARAPDMQAAAQRLAGVISALVRTAGSLNDGSSAHIEALVLERSKDLLDAQRAWFGPQGWEPDPAKIPPIEAALKLRTAS